MTTLLSLPDRELDARLAECMGVAPEVSWALRLGCSVTFWPDEAYARSVRVGLLPQVRERATVERNEKYPAYSSPSSPRSLLESVEAEIEKRELSNAYLLAIGQLLSEKACGSDCPVCHDWLLATAPAKVRTAAAVMVMEAK